MKKTRSILGLTLVETIVAMALLAVAAVSMIALQQASLHAESTADTSRQAQILAENELARQATNPSAPDCHIQADLPEHYTCTTEVHACGLEGGVSNVHLRCDRTPLVTHSQLLVVTIEGPRDARSTLTALRQP